MNLIDLHQAIAKHNQEFLDVLSDCLDNLTSLPEWFAGMDLDDPDLSDRKAAAYFEIVAGIQTAVDYQPDVPYQFSSQEMDSVAGMLLPGLNLMPLNAMALEAAVQTLMHNSNKTLSETFKVQTFIENPTALKLPEGFDEDRAASAMKRLDLQLSQAAADMDEINSTKALF